MALDEIYTRTHKVQRSTMALNQRMQRSATALNEIVVMLVHPPECLSSSADETLGRHRPHTTVVRFKGTTALIRLVQDKAIKALRSRRNRAHGDECKKGSHNMAA